MGAINLDGLNVQLVMGNSNMSKAIDGESVRPIVKGGTKAIGWFWLKLYGDIYWIAEQAVNLKNQGLAIDQVQ